MSTATVDAIERTPLVPTPRSRRLALAAAVPAVLLASTTLTGCGLQGFNAQTEAVYQPAEGTNDRDGDVDVLGALVVSPQNGSGVFICTLSNNDQTRTDQLTDVQASGVQIASGATPTISPGGFVNLASSSIGGIPVTGSSVKAGGFVTVKLTFKHAEPVTIMAPVVTATGPYATVVPSASASASASPSN